MQYQREHVLKENNLLSTNKKKPKKSERRTTESANFKISDDSESEMSEDSLDNLNFGSNDIKIKNPVLSLRKGA